MSLHLVNTSNVTNPRAQSLTDLNSKLRGQDMRDMINERRSEHAHNLEHEPLYLYQRLAEIQNNPVHQQIADLLEQIEWLRRNNDP